MIHHCSFTIRFGCLCLWSLWSLTASTAASSEAWDPTSPSPLIKAMAASVSPQHSSHEQTPARAEEKPDAIKLTLQGLMLRDSDHGTAIVGWNGGTSRIVLLQRNRLALGQSLVKLGPTTLTVTDFSDTMIVLQSRDGSQKYIVKPTNQTRAAAQ